MNSFASRLFISVYLVLLIILSSCSFEGSKEKTPVIYLTDLYHPFNDPDDHFDLAALYALNQFDIKAIIIDCALNNKMPGKIPIEQLNTIFKRNVPYYLGLKNKLRSPDDTGEDQPYNQDGCKAILNVLSRSDKKVTIIAVGSLRDVAAAYNRNPLLFETKVDKLVIFAGEARNRDFFEYNVTLDKNAYIQVMNNIPNIYWVPCFDGGLWLNNGYASFWRDHHSELLNGASKPILNYFLYALSQSTDTVSYISCLQKPANETDLHNYILDKNIPLRSLWCCSVFPYFVTREKTVFPFEFEKIRARVDSNAVLHYSETGNQLSRFRITDPSNYGNKMTTIYNHLINK